MDPDYVIIVSMMVRFVFYLSTTPPQVNCNSYGLLTRLHYTRDRDLTWLFAHRIAIIILMLALLAWLALVHAIATSSMRIMVTVLLHMLHCRLQPLQWRYEFWWQWLKRKCRDTSDNFAARSVQMTADMIVIMPLLISRGYQSLIHRAFTH
jgi:fatty acid desaturase